MRKLILATVTVAAVLLGGSVASAEAHTLSKGRAANAVNANLYDWALSGERDFEVLTEVDTVTRRDCIRYSAHRVDCVGSYGYDALDGEEYDDGTTFMDCVVSAVVRYPRWSYRPTVRFRDEECW